MTTSPWRRFLGAAAVCFLAVSLPGGGLAEAQELLTNPGFESGALAPWTTDGSWAVTATGCHSGTYCATDTGNYYIEQTFPPIPGLSVTSFTFWMRQPEPGASAIVFYYTDGTSAYGSTTFPSAAWTRFDKTAEIDDTKTLSAIRIWGYVGAGPAPDVTFLDDVSLVGTPVVVPTIASVSPASGPTTGGTVVTIAGTNLTGATAVSFGGVAAASFTVDSSTQVTATTAPHAAGVADVAVTAPGGTATATDAFAFVVPPPSIAGLSPASGPDTGGVAVTITGTDLAGAVSVTFGGVPGTITANTDTSITVTAPPHAVGGVDVTVTTAGGSATLAFGFFYLGEAIVPTLSGGMLGLLALALAGIAVWKLRT